MTLAHHVMYGLKLVFGAIVVEGSVAEARVIEVPELVGRKGEVRFQPTQSVPNQLEAGVIMTSSPRSEAVWMVAIALAVIPIFVASIVTIVSGDATAASWFIALWSILWVAVTVSRLALQGRALKQILVSLGGPDVSWTSRRLGALPARRR